MMDHMLSSQPGQPQTGGAAADVVKDTTTAQFKADVIDASKETPVVIDFWAPWCGPCKQLGPMLEKTVRAARGKVRMVKLNVDENQQLAAQMGIQSIPAVYAFWQGRPVDGFVGAQPESTVKQFVDKLAHLAGAGDAHLQELLAKGKSLMEEERWEEAGGLYSHLLQHDPGNATAAAGLARCLVHLGRIEDAEGFIAQLDEDLAKHPEVVSVKSLIDLTKAAEGAASDLLRLESAVAQNPADHQARIDLAQALVAVGRREDAVDQLLESIRRNRDWNEQAARKQLLKLFEAFGATDPITVSARRRLSSILFS